MDDYWFSRYPRRLYCINDNVGDFVGEGFIEMLESYGVQLKPITEKNLQSNGLHEKLHLVLCKILRSENLYVNQNSTARKKINRFLQSAAYTMCTSTHMITKYSRGQLIFHRGMNTHTKVIVDWELIHARRRAQ